MLKGKILGMLKIAIDNAIEKDCQNDRRKEVKKLDRTIEAIKEAGGKELECESTFGLWADLTGEEVTFRTSTKNVGCLKLTFEYKGVTFSQELTRAESQEITGRKMNNYDLETEKAPATDDYIIQLPELKAL